MSAVPITIATGRYDRTSAIQDGRAVVEGCDVTYLNLEPEELFFRAFRYAEFDVAELSFSSYILQHQRGVGDYLAIPVFPSRMFRHSGFYIRTDRGIETPADLAGKQVGVAEYQMTAAVWQRGLLSDDFGVAAESIQWRTGGIEQPGRVERSPLTLHRDVPVTPLGAGQTLSGMLASGELDAVVLPRPPSCFVNGAPHVGRLFPDYRAAEQAWYRACGLHPIMHVVGVRRELAEQYPWLPSNLFKAFSLAKQLAVADLERLITLSVTLPWVGAELAATRALMGDDFWPYGVDANRRDIETLVRYSMEQGLIPQPVDVDSLFAPSTLTVSKI
ncbi:MAG: 4,5-dihydroxyphthalate decarboxylase [Gammaproteobacteria bacterium]|jgi:4,5-dihydroxyphthalate decarboxylase